MAPLDQRGYGLDRHIMFVASGSGQLWRDELSANQPAHSDGGCRDDARQFPVAAIRRVRHPSRADDCRAQADGGAVLRTSRHLQFRR